LSQGVAGGSRTVAGPAFGRVLQSRDTNGLGDVIDLVRRRRRAARAHRSAVTAIREQSPSDAAAADVEGDGASHKKRTEKKPKIN